MPRAHASSGVLNRQLESAAGGDPEPAQACNRILEEDVVDRSGPTMSYPRWGAGSIVPFESF